MDGMEEKSPGRFRRRAFAPDDAVKLILRHVRPLETETAALQDAWGRSLAEPAKASFSVPSFRRSAMDGYAVRFEDLPPEETAGPVTLEVLENLQAGTVPVLAVGRGQASRIMTGAMMPEGADTVVMLEMTQTEHQDGKSFVRIGKSVPRGRNVAAAGSEVQAGELLFPAGRRIGAGETALLASCGFASVPVVRRPRVGILSTGSELLAPGDPPAIGKIPNSNAPMLAALLRETGADPVLYAPAPDRAELAEELIRKGLADNDMLITTGGVSVGDSDILVDILAGWEGTTLFNKVAMRPGSPTTAAVLDGRLLLALSGNPGACFVGFHLFAVPAIRAMLRTEPVRISRFKARLAAPFAKVNAYTRYVRAQTGIRDGTVWVRPTGEDKSSLIATIPDADCLMVIPPQKRELEAGSFVEAIPLREGFSGWT